MSFSVRQVSDSLIFKKLKNQIHNQFFIHVVCHQNDKEIPKTSLEAVQGNGRIKIVLYNRDKRWRKVFTTVGKRNRDRGVISKAGMGTLSR